VNEVRNRFNGFSPLGAVNPYVSPAPCAVREGKPLKRFTLFVPLITGLKPGVNERRDSLSLKANHDAVIINRTGASALLLNGSQVAPFFPSFSLEQWNPSS
jgi:hypothetical protein